MRMFLTTQFLQPRTVVATFFVLVTLVGQTPLAVGANSNFAGRWLMTITIPESPGSRSSRTFVVNVNVNARGDSLVGRMTLTDAENRVAPGVWRQTGKRIWFSYELPCSVSSGVCATLVITGKLKFEDTRFKKGRVIIVWDTANDRDPSLYDTSLGTVVADRTT